MIPAQAGKNAVPSRSVLLSSLLFLAIYFAVASSDGLHAYFTQDDGGNVLNMHKYWEHSLGDVIGSAIQVVSGAYRPLGGIYYFVLYRLAGYDPMPFRAVCLLLMLANVFLAFALLRRLSGSFDAGLLGAILITHHPVVLDLLYSSGTIYEIFCFFFYFLALWCYVGWRQAGPVQSWRHLLILLILTGCALDSKEMAMTLPGALLLIELIYFPAPRWSMQEAARFVRRQCRGVLLTAGLVAPAIAVKVLTQNPLSEDRRYAEHSLHATIDALRGYHSFFLGSDIRFGGLTVPLLVALWVVMGVAAVALRSRPMVFGLCFLVFSLLPVCLIAPRNGYMAYLPSMGWALYFACLFELLRNRVIRLADLDPHAARATRLATFAGAAVLIMYNNAIAVERPAAGIRQEQDAVRRVVARLRSLHPQLPRGSKLLLVDNPLPASYELLFLMRLAQHDPKLELDRLDMLPKAPAGDAVTHYDYVVSGGWDAHDVRGIGDARPPLAVVLQPASVAAGGVYKLEIPDFPGQKVDLGVRTLAGQQIIRAVLRDVQLDASGGAARAAPVEFPNAAMEVRWVRPSGGSWKAASGVLQVR